MWLTHGLLWTVPVTVMSSGALSATGSLARRIAPAAWAMLAPARPAR